MTSPDALGLRCRSPALVGVLGGMGPQATLDFLQKLVSNTPAGRDQEHLPVLVASVPQIPDRTRAFQGRGESPLPALRANARRLVAGGVDLIVMPCNTAHLWFDALAATLPVPMLHIVDAALDAITARCGEAVEIGLLATSATIDSGLYPSRSRRIRTSFAPRWHVPTVAEQADWVTPAIEAIKAGRTREATSLLLNAGDALIARGASALLLACTELPLALSESALSVPVIDAGEALARQTVRWHEARPRRACTP